MQLFYDSGVHPDTPEIILDGQEARHIVKVLRHVTGDHIHLTNGKGWLIDAVIRSVSTRSVVLESVQQTFTEPPSYRHITLGVGLLKNKDRMEWLAEKATEIGIGELVWLHTSRSERGAVRLDRMEAVMVSAMKQSLQTWMPDTRVLRFDDVVEEAVSGEKTIILAHEQAREKFNSAANLEPQPVLLLVGPEGGFTQEEVENVVKSGGKSLLLGQNRLRTETAALTLLQYYHLSTQFR